MFPRQGVTHSIFIISTALALSACNESTVDIVKSQYIDRNATTTTGQLLDNNLICESIIWESNKDHLDRDVVSYTCTLKGTADIEAQRIKALNERINYHNETILNRIKDYESRIAEAKSSIEHKTANREQIIREKIEKDRVEVQSFVYVNEHLDEMQEFLPKLIDAKRGGKEAIKALLSEKESPRLMGIGAEGYTKTAIHQAVGAMSVLNSENETNADYYREELEYTLVEIEKNLPNIIEGLKAEIAREKEDERQTRESRDFSITDRYALYSNELDESIAESKKVIERYEGDIQRYRDTIIDPATRPRQKIFSKVYDRHAWIVNADDDATYLGHVIEGQVEGTGEITNLYKRDDQKTLIGIAKINNNKQDHNYATYINYISTVSF